MGMKDTGRGKTVQRVFILFYFSGPFEIDICSKDWFVQNQNNVSEWKDICTLELLFSVS
jgi:hypothetical protein